ncbi:MAG: amidase domain-containing protein [Halanaerobiales bacterium]
MNSAIINLNLEGNMIILLSRRRIIFSILVISLILFSILLVYQKVNYINGSVIYVDDPRYDMLTMKIQEIFEIRNTSILKKDPDKISNLYDQNLRNGRWACAHALQKMEYLHSWSSKQGINFKDINSTVKVRYVKTKGEGFSVNLLVSTEYDYFYDDSPEEINSFRIGTYHSLDLMPIENGSESSITSPDPHITEHNLLITREWYTDPFADSLSPDIVDKQDVTNMIKTGVERDLSTINERRKNAMVYAEKYCGAASLPEYDYKYNPDYRNYNNLGGDCANFASQILYEGGKFPKSGAWNYYRGNGSSAWVNASAFNNFMIYSGRASLLAHGNYEQVLKQSYQLLPGDYIAYEKKGKVVHISVVWGIDSKGYTLVVSHNTDRYKVPWDLGWSNKNIKFRLVRVHY